MTAALTRTRRVADNVLLTTADVTPTYQQHTFTTAALVGSLESAWTAIRSQHPEIPAAVIIVGSGSTSKKSNDLKYGHYATLRWQLGDTQLPEVLVSGEGLRRSPAEVFTTLLHEAAHALADRRGIKDTSRQGRWHNKHFALLAAELGLTATKDPRIGWSPCTLRPDTASAYASVIDELTTAMRAYRHPEDIGENTRTTNNNGVVLECACPRKIRVSNKVADEGPIRCGVCRTRFRTDNDDDTDDHQDQDDQVHDTDEEENDMGRSIYDPTGQHHHGMPTYPYKFAPTGLATRRQLRRLNLRPGSQPIAAQILWRKGKRVAHLYRIDLARPKRTPTPAQLAALAKAMLARRTCTTCEQVKDYYIPHRYGECLDCAGVLAGAA